MEFQIAPNRVFAEAGDGRLLAEVTFPRRDESSVTIDHTFVDPSLRGQGVAGQLLQAAADALRATGRKAFPTCSYARAWFQEHPEQADLLEQRNTQEPG